MASASVIDSTRRAAEGALRFVGEMTSNGRDLQSSASHRIDQLARGIRYVATPNPATGRKVARQLEKTADYLRYRPTREMARDAVSCARRHPGAVMAGVASALLAYKFLCRAKKAR